MTLLRCLPLAALFALGCGSGTTDTAQSELNQRIYWMEDSVSWVEVKNGKFGIYWEGKMTIEPVYDIDNLMESILWDGYAYFSEGAHFALGREGKWGVLDNYGTVIIPLEYEHVKIQREEASFVTRFAGLRKDGKYAIAGPGGELVTDFVYDEFYGDFHWREHPNPIIAMAKGDRIVFYDYDNHKELTEAPEGEFEQPTVAVRLKDKAGVIIQDGTFVVPPEYEGVFFVGGTGPWYYGVCNDGICGLFLTGKGLVLPIKYGSISLFDAYDRNFYVAQKDEHFGLVSNDGEELTEFKYDDIFKDDSLGIVAWVGNKVYKIDENGTEAFVRDVENQ